MSDIDFIDCLHNHIDGYCVIYTIDAHRISHIAHRSFYHCRRCWYILCLFYVFGRFSFFFHSYTFTSIYLNMFNNFVTVPYSSLIYCRINIDKCYIVLWSIRNKATTWLNSMLRWKEHWKSNWTAGRIKRYCVDNPTDALYPFPRNMRFGFFSECFE